MQAIHILDMNLNLLGEIAHYKNLRLRRKFREAGDFEMVLPLNHPMAERLARDRILCPVGQREKAMLIEEIAKSEGTDTISVKGYTLSGLLRRRVCIPPDGGAGNFGYDRIIADAESVMRHYVSGNVVAPQSDARRMPCMALETVNGHRGMQQVPWSARFEQLDELLFSIGAYCDAGFSVVPDFEQKKLVFTFLPGRDMTGAENGNHVIFGVHMGNAAQATLQESAQQAKNAAVVGGAGEDENRLILTVCPGGETGVARREVFVDAGSLAQPDDLVKEGERRLGEKRVARAIRAQVVQTASCCYGKQWELGDLVTVVAHGEGMQARITQVQESHEAGKPVTLEVTFGEAAADLGRLLRQSVKSMVR